MDKLTKALDDILAWMERKQEVRRRDYWERRLMRKINIAFKGQNDKVIELLGDPPRLENIPASFWEGAGIEFTRQVRPVLEEIFMQQAADMIQTVPIGVDWALVNTGAVDWARKYTFELVKGINETTRDTLGKIIGEAFEKDLTRAELEQLIGELYNPIRSEMIAITEVTRASNEGTTEIRNELSEQGIEMDAVWNTRNDENICDICGPLNGQKADHFTDDGEPVWIHPETDEEIEHTPHPRCRCSYGLELPEEKKAVKYSEDQPRDEAGRWTNGGGGVGAGEGNAGAGNIGDNNGKPYGDKFNNGKPYYRSTPTDDPMSDWGHAMMADNDGVVDQFGSHNWIFDPSGTTSGVVNIEDLDSKITEAWNNTQERGYYDTNGADISYEMDSFGAEEIRASFNPSDIVNGAEGYDTDLAIWLYAEVLEPNNIGAVITNDGAVVYDPQMLKQIK